MSNTVLIVDDEEDIRDLVSDILSDEGYNCRTAANSTQTFKEIEQHKPTIILLDIWLQNSDLDGLGILEVIQEKYPFIPVIIISGHGTIETAVTAIKFGAYDYIEKPFSPEKLNITVKRALEAAKLKRENLELKKKISTKPELVGNSPAIVQLKSQIEKISPTSSRVLIKGEYGSGKELVAKLIHKLSNKRNHPFVTINSSILNNEKIKHDLLGDPNEKKFGIAEIASNGTLYIDNIAELPKQLQLNILKFIQGNKTSQSVSKHNIRIIASIHSDIDDIVKMGKLVKDLLYRINVVSVEVPPLRNRKDDIIKLAKFFLKNIEKTEGFSPREISDDVIATLQTYNWPGNIRELKNVIEKLFIAANVKNKDMITADLLSDNNSNDSATGSINLSTKNDMDIDFMSLPLRQAREVFERYYLSSQMSRFNQNISKTSIFIGMERSALHRKLKMLNIHANNNSASEDKEEIAVKETI